MSDYTHAVIYALGGWAIAAATGYTWPLPLGICLAASALFRATYVARHA